MGRLFFICQIWPCHRSCSLPPASHGCGRSSIAGQFIPPSLCTNLHRNVIAVRTSGQSPWTFRWGHALRDIGGRMGRRVLSYCQSV